MAFAYHNIPDPITADLSETHTYVSYLYCFEILTQIVDFMQTFDLQDFHM